jgi:hypothetical protein
MSKDGKTRYNMQPNAYTQFLALLAVIPQDDLYTVIMENNDQGQPIFVGRSIVAGASTSDSIWAITQIVYDSNGYLININLPVGGQGFQYIWDDRDTYF